jgi:FkbM family methyltransferase
MPGLKEEKEISGLFLLRKKRDKSAFLKGIKEAVIYGAGATGGRVAAILKEHDITIRCFLDARAVSGQGSPAGDIPVWTPDTALPESVLTDAVVIAAMFNHMTGVAPVLRLLREKGFQKVMPFQEFYGYFEDEMEPRYWLVPDSFYDGKEKIIARGLSVFEDRESRELYRTLLKSRFTGDPGLLENPDIPGIYFPAGIPHVKKPENMVDCGAYTGDSLIQVRERFGKIRAICAFEPDPSNFRTLSGLVDGSRKGKNGFADEIFLFPCGVWSSTDRKKFSSDSTLSSSISDQGGATIQCVALDDVLKGTKPSMIKMDIEGAEIEALQGAVRTISESSPDLAISAYHSPDHLWKIPLMIRDLDPGYRIYLRSHGFSGYDTVVYAYKRG